MLKQLSQMEEVQAWDQRVSEPIQSLNWVLLGYFIVGVVANVLLFSRLDSCSSKQLKFFMKWFAITDITVCITVPLLSYWRNAYPLTSQGNCLCSWAYFETRTVCSMPGLLLIVVLLREMLEYYYPGNNPISWSTVKKSCAALFVYSIILHLPMLVIYGDVIIENQDALEFKDTGIRCGLKSQELNDSEQLIKKLYKTAMITSALSSLVALLVLTISVTLITTFKQTEEQQLKRKREIVLYLLIALTTFSSYAASLTSFFMADTDSAKFWSKQWSDEDRKAILFMNDLFLFGHAVKPFLYWVVAPMWKDSCADKKTK